MLEILKRLAVRPVLAFEMLVASLFANILALATPIFVIQVLNRYVAHGVDSTLVTLAGGAIIAVALEYGFRRVRLRFAEAVNAGPNEALALNSYDVLTTAKAAAVDMLPPGIRREIISGADTIRQSYTATHLCTAMDVPFALVFVAALFLLAPMLALVAVTFLIIVFVLVAGGLMSLRGPTREMTTITSRRGALVESAIVGADAVRAFNSSGFLKGRWAGEVKALEGLRRRVGLRQSAVTTSIQSLTALMTIALITVAALLVVSGSLDVGAMIGANIMAARALQPVAGLAQQTEGWAKAKQARDMFREFSRLPRERQDGTAIANYSGRLEIKDASFSYPGASGPLFEQLNLSINAGEVLVITGANGSGKTTLARMLVGLLEPGRGNLLVDGVDLAQIAPAWWRQQVVYLPQEPRFMNATLRENLLAFNPTLDAGAMHDLMVRVGLDKYVDENQMGLDLMMVNGGSNLSLGIRRRLALARALSHNGKLLILDEPTEGLDADGARHVYNVMNNLAGQGHTIIACSHDAHIIRGAHHLLDLNIKPIPRFSSTATKGGQNDQVAQESAGPEVPIAPEAAS
jgi:ATP-binding cassette, subfamily C, bacterial LapB